MLKKFFIGILTIITIFICNNNVTTFAYEQSNDYQENLETTYEENQAVEELPFSSITPYLIIGMNHSTLGVNKFIKSDNAFNFKKGEKVKIKNVTWSPTTQKIQLGFVNATNGDQYWTTSYSGGNKIGGTFSLGGPSGRYYIAIRTPSTNNKIVNVKGQFEF